MPMCVMASNLMVLCARLRFGRQQNRITQKLINKRGNKLAHGRVEHVQIRAQIRCSVFFILLANHFFRRGIFQL